MHGAGSSTEEQRSRTIVSAKTRTVGLLSAACVRMTNFVDHASPSWIRQRLFLWRHFTRSFFEMGYGQTVHLHLRQVTFNASCFPKVTRVFALDRGQPELIPLLSDYAPQLMYFFYPKSADLNHAP
jgi:hypothetical protein